MIKVGIIGDIGSGKSHVAKLFGFPVFNADHEVLKIYKKDKFCFKKLKKKLPNHINSFPIKKSEIFNAINKNKNNLKKITKIVHPIVRFNMNKFFKKYKNKKMVILDVPLLLENKINKKNYILVYVDAKKNQIYKRLKKRPNFNIKIFNKLKNLQLPLEVKKKKANFIIKNNFQISSIKKNVKMLKKRILKK
tara:strand:+ start:1802 stop:2377 length:576 start_codon:yes stop_codon:yes gene_type:complete